MYLVCDLGLMTLHNSCCPLVMVSMFITFDGPSSDCSAFVVFIRFADRPKDRQLRLAYKQEAKMT